MMLVVGPLSTNSCKIISCSWPAACARGVRFTMLATVRAAFRGSKQCQQHNGPRGLVWEISKAFVEALEWRGLANTLSEAEKQKERQRKKERKKERERKIIPVTVKTHIQKHRTIMKRV